MSYRVLKGSRYHRRRLWRRLVMIFILTALGAAVFYGLFMTEWFKVKRIEVSGNVAVAAEDIVKVENNEGYIWQRIELLPRPVAVREVEISRLWFSGTVLVDVKEREEFAVWCVKGGGCYWIDDQGIIFKEALRPEGSLVALVESEIATDMGEKVLPDRLVVNLIKVIELLRSVNVGFNRIDVLDLRFEEVNVSVFEGPELRFSLRIDPEFTKSSLEKLKDNFTELEYIDFRSENRVFYKEL